MSLTLAGGETATLTYGDTSQGGPGATATPTSGAQSWNMQEASTSTSTLTSLSSSPQVSVVSADGSGSLTASRTLVSAGQTNTTTTFTYTAAAGGTSGGTVKLVVPSGWSAPSVNPANGGYTTASTGTVSISSRTISITNVTLVGGGQLTIVFGSRTGGGAGAKAPAAVGQQAWNGSEQSIGAGAAVALVSSPRITVLAPDGSGTMTPSVTSVVHSAPHQTIVLTYTTATGGTSKGTVTVAVPVGWSAPSLTSTAPGYVRTSRGSVSVSSRTISVGGLNLTAGTHFTITYGVKAAGGPGATASTATGAQTWTTRERSWTGGALKLLGPQPTITVN
jgi:hypothetical protein